MNSAIFKIKSRIKNEFEILETLYGDDQDLHFRAVNLTALLWTTSFVVSILAGVFAFVSTEIMDMNTKLIFVPIFATLISLFYYCNHLVAKGKISVARRIVLTMSVIAVAFAIIFTGGFPHSVSVPALILPVIFGYCMYGGRMAATIAIATPILVAIQILAFNTLDFKIPDFTSQSSPAANITIIITTVFALNVLALFSYDRFNRKFLKTAKDALQIKTDFLANMSHEIRTPMNGVMGMTEILLASELNERQRSYAEVIDKSGNALLRIINDILDFSKIEAGKLEFEEEPFNLEELVDEVGDLLGLSARKKTLNLITHYQNDLPSTLVGDAGYLRQILLNLVGNAIKFTETGYVFLGVTGKSLINSVRLDFVIRDTGIGISEKDQKTIFDTFSQADNSRTRIYGGSGLGLSICNSLVEALGGTINVKSVVNKGSMFSFQIELPQNKERDGEKSSKLDLQNQIILIVDELKVCRSVVSDFIKSVNGRPIAVKNAENAIEKISKIVKAGLPIPVIITDFNMPAQNGFSIAAFMRTHYPEQSHKTIVVSSVHDSKIETQLSTLGVGAYLSRPVRKSSMEKALKSALMKPVEMKAIDQAVAS